MTQERQPDSTGEGATGSTGDTVESMPKTVEEVEAFWRNRFSQRDRAHNAETAALKAQMDALRQAPVIPGDGESPEAARVRELEARLAQSEAARQAEALRSQYPYAASVLGEEITRLSPEKIAALEAGGTDGGQGVIAPRMDPNAAGRSNTSIQSPQVKPDSEKTKEELLGDLRRIAPVYQEAAREGLL